jgi:hypothetical protein
VLYFVNSRGTQKVIRLFANGFLILIVTGTGLGNLRLASQLATLKGVKKSFFKLFLLHEYYLGVSSDPINLIWSHG